MQQPPNPYPQFQPQQWQQPPMPPLKKKSRKGLFIVLGVILTVVLFGCIGVSAMVNAGGQAAQQTLNQTSTHVAQIPTTQPTAKPTTQPTAKPTVKTTTGMAVTHGTPHLGGPISDFIGAYGQPDHQNNPGQYAAQYGFQRDANTTDVTDGIIIVTSTDSKTSVDDITVAAVAQNATYNDPQAGSSFSPSDAKARCMTFAPTDAHFVKEFVYADNTGFDMVYTSASLAQSFPAGDFTDSQQNQVKAGMFDVSYLYKSNGDTQHIDSCDMIIGEQQTAN